MQWFHTNPHHAIIGTHHQRSTRELTCELSGVVMSYFLMKLEDRLRFVFTKLANPDYVVTLRWTALKECSDVEKWDDEKCRVFAIRSSLRDAVCETKRRFPIFTFFDPRDVFIRLLTWDAAVAAELRNELKSSCELVGLSRFMKPYEFNLQQYWSEGLFSRTQLKFVEHLDGDVVKTLHQKDSCAMFLSHTLGDEGGDLLLQYWQELEVLFSRYPHVNVTGDEERLAQTDTWDNQLESILRHCLSQHKFNHNSNVVYLAQVVAFASCAFWKHATRYSDITNTHPRMSATELSHIFPAPIDDSIWAVLNKLPDAQHRRDRYSFSHHGAKLGKALPHVSLESMPLGL